MKEICSQSVCALSRSFATPTKSSRSEMNSTRSIDLRWLASILYFVSLMLRGDQETVLVAASASSRTSKGHRRKFATDSKQVQKTRTKGRTRSGVNVLIVRRCAEGRALVVVCARGVSISKSVRSLATSPFHFRDRVLRSIDDQMGSVSAVEVVDVCRCCTGR